MKVLILCAGNLKHMSLITIYTRLLKQASVKYDLLYMDKYDEVERNEADKVFRFVNVINPEWSKLKKAFKYWQFRSYAINVLSKNDYSFIIVWKDTTAFMFADYLAKHWSGKYCLNIRDDNHYQNLLIRAWYTPVFRNAAFRTISSDAYRSFLPKFEYIHIHSLNESILQMTNPRKETRDINKPIRIGFVGYVRFFEINKKLLSVFKNDNRFELHYYGTHASTLENYANENRINNAVFFDSFQVDDTAKFLDNIDVMNNLYGNETINLATALSIKLYHAVYMRIPLLVSPKTHMEQITTDMGLGFVVHSIDSSLPDAFFKWYRGLNQEVIDYNCTMFIKKVENENRCFEHMFCSLLTKLSYESEDAKCI